MSVDDLDVESFEQSCQSRDQREIQAGKTFSLQVPRYSHLLEARRVRGVRIAVECHDMHRVPALDLCSGDVQRHLFGAADLEGPQDVHDRAC